MERLLSLAVLALCLLRSLAAPDDSTCYGYITGSHTYLNDTGPFPIECGSSRFGDGWGPSAYQDLSCCSGDGRYFVNTGQIGGFDFGFDSYYDSFAEQTFICTAHANLLQALLCDPRQGNFISNNVFRVCRSSCDAVFDACGPPGEIFPAWTSYNDGTSLCYGMWGFFGSEPCQSRPRGFPCQADLSIEVVDSDCIGIIEPSEKELKQYLEEEEAPHPCDDHDDGVFAGAIAGIIVAGLLLFIFVIVWCYLRRSRRSEASGVALNSSSPDARVDEEPIFHGTGDSKKLPPMVVATPMPKDETSHPNPSAPYCLSAQEPEAAVLRTTEPAVASATQLPIVVVGSVEHPTVNPFGASSLIAVIEEAQTHEKSQAIKNWVREHPNEAAVLKPSDVGEVLSKVTFSLDQTSAAAELAFGLGSAITCTHVAAALRMCSEMNKADIAKAMVSHVNDPQNKGVVLDEIRFDFERNEVARRFPKI